MFVMFLSPATYRLPLRLPMLMAW